MYHVLNCKVISTAFILLESKTIFQHINTNYKKSELCTGLPPEITSLTTEESFPVSYNSAVTVSCSGDNELRGDNIITCNQDTDFGFSVKPKCNEIGQ